MNIKLALLIGMALGVLLGGGAMYYGKDCDCGNSISKTGRPDWLPKQPDTYNVNDGEPLVYRH